LANIYYDNDADLNVLKGKIIAIIGYGIQGRAQALNLRDSGCDVVVGCRAGKSWEAAQEDGMNVVATEEAAMQGDVIQILAQDHLQPDIYRHQVAKFMKDGDAMVFSHGFNIHFNQIVPPPTVDVLMVAPKGPGQLVRTEYERGAGVPALLAIHQDYTGNAAAIGKAYAKAIGATRAGLFETTFKEETETDLFGEQVVLCGGVSELIRAAFDTLVEAGYSPEMAYFECCHELKLIVDLIYEGGITGMRQRVSDTAKYGDMTRGPRVIGVETRAEMKRVLNEVQTGQFAREWILENQVNRPVFNATFQRDANHLVEQVGARLRSMMPWIKQKS
jgi:ketol-acid reductoisomerase